MTVPRKRRWFKFSLRTLFVVVLVLAGPLAWIANERAQSQYECQLTERLRIQGVPVFIFLGPFDSWELHCQSQPQGWWPDLARMAFGERIVYVDGAGSALEDATLFAGLTNLQVVNLNGTAVKDLSPLSDLTNLRVLNLNGTAVRDLSPLSGLTNLQVLRFEGTSVSDPTPITQLMALSEIRFSRMYVGPEQVTALQQSVPNCRINDRY